MTEEALALRVPPALRCSRLRACSCPERTAGQPRMIGRANCGRHTGAALPSALTGCVSPACSLGWRRRRLAPKPRGHHPADALSCVRPGDSGLRGALHAHAAPVSVNVTAPAGTQVDVDGQGARTGTFTTSVPLRPGQGFGITVIGGPAAGSTTCAACRRTCLAGRSSAPASRRRSGSRAAPVAKTNFQPHPPAGLAELHVHLRSQRRAGLVEQDGPTPARTFDVAERPDVASLRGGNDGGQERRPGRLVRAHDPAASARSADPHELMRAAERELPDHHGQDDHRHRPTAATRMCRSSTTACRRSRLRARSRVDMVGVRPHLDCPRCPGAWCSAIDRATTAYDPYHINSIEPDGNDVLMSFRHLNAVYSVRKSNGSVEWKIGGVTRPESLTVLNDPVFTARRRIPRRSTTRGTCPTAPSRCTTTASAPRPRRPPRAVRYALDLNARTATLVEQKNDPDDDARPRSAAAARASCPAGTG